MQKTLKFVNLNFIFIAIESLITAIFMALFSIQLGKIIDNISDNNFNLSKETVICFLFLSIWGINQLLLDYCTEKFIQKKMISIKNFLTYQFLQKELSNNNIRGEKKYLNNVTKNMDILSENYFTSICSIVSHSFSVCVSIVAIISIEWKLAFCFFIISLMTIMICQMPGYLVVKKTTIYSQANEKFLNYSKNFATGFEQIKLLNIENFILKKIKQINSEFEQTRFSYNFSKDFVSTFTMYVSFFSQLICMAVGVYFVKNGMLTIGLLISCIQLLNGIFSPLQQIMYFRNLISSVKDIKNEINLSDLTIQDVISEKQKKRINQICLENICLKIYDKDILKNFTYSFETGNSYAIIGSSGTGKSSLAKLILGYYNSDEYNGEIVFNTEDGEQLSAKQVYHSIAYICSNQFYIDGSIEENIILKNINKKDKLQNLANEIKLTDKLLAKQIKDTDNSLSQGERQKVELLRFLIHDYPVYIFDEPTSHLDPENTKLVINYINSIKDAIKIVITHDQSQENLSHFDHIIRFP
ncbi:ATP-binding cassette domain-containing protein [Streptococcus hongkongensis]|nr:hypothetical protein NC01_02435 [Streptococcus uberis]